MFRLSKCARAFALGLLMTLLSFSYASAHCFVGARFFPATLATDDPCVADEMSLPTVAWFKTGDNPPASEVDISVDISKRITEDFGVTIGDTWSQIRQPGNPTREGSPISIRPFNISCSRTLRSSWPCSWGCRWNGAVPATPAPAWQRPLASSPQPSISVRGSARFPKRSDGLGRSP